MSDQHQGRLYALDFIANSDWVQLLMHTDGDPLIAVTRDPRCITILAAAMAGDYFVEIDTKGHQPSVVTRVNWNLDTQPPTPPRHPHP